MAISDAVKVGYMSVGTIDAPGVGVSIAITEDKQAYTTKIARIAVGETDPDDGETILTGRPPVVAERTSE